MRNIIVHCHMFKNAGSTLDWSLERHFEQSFCDHRDDEPMRDEEGYLERYLIENDGLKAISSHHVLPPYPENNAFNIIPAFLLRHPIDRIGSVYEFEKKQDATTPGAIHAKKYSLEEYVIWRMRPDVGATIRSFQVRYCSGGIKRAVIDQSDFDKAVTSLQNTPLVGIVEKYDESMVIYEEALKPYFPEIDLAYIPQNMGERRKVAIEDRIEKVTNQLTNETSKLLLANNQYEIALYDYATELFAKRKQTIPDFDTKLENFSQRCNELS